MSNKTRFVWNDEVASVDGENFKTCVCLKTGTAVVLRLGERGADAGRSFSFIQNKLIMNSQSSQKDCLGVASNVCPRTDAPNVGNRFTMDACWPNKRGDPSPH